MRNRNTVEFLRIWESLYNPNFKGHGFDTFRKDAGLNNFSLTPQKWINATGAIGIRSKAGRGGGTFAHKDIAFEFGSWISPMLLAFVTTKITTIEQLNKYICKYFCRNLNKYYYNVLFDKDT